jgi:class 3 adenylate cyclase
VTQPRHARTRNAGKERETLGHRNRRSAREWVDRRRCPDRRKYLHTAEVTGSTYWGRSVVTAARIEPRTPEGEVYVTEPFAALLALDPAAGIAAEYVGHLRTAKGFGELPMYVLRRRSPDHGGFSR